MKPVLILLGSLVLLVLVFLSGVIITANVIGESEPHKFAHMDTPDLWTEKAKSVDPVKQAYERLPAVTAPTDVAATDVPAKPLAAINGASPVPASGVASNTGQVAAVDNTVTASLDPQPSAIGNPPMQNSQVNTAQADFCYARYRSYRIEDNSYQPFNGGPRRQCEAPGMAGAQTVAAVAPSNTQSSFQQAQQRQDALQPMRPEPVSANAPQAYEEAPRYVGDQAVDNGAPAGAHEQWCSARYRSYRVDDNSYQPFEGGSRRSCQSPFG